MTLCQELLCAVIVARCSLPEWSQGVAQAPSAHAAWAQMPELSLFCPPPARREPITAQWVCLSITWGYSTANASLLTLDAVLEQRRR